MKKKIFQFLVLSLIILSGVHGSKEDDNCNDLSGQLADHSLQMVYLDSDGQLIYESGTAPASLCYKAERDSDAVRIDEFKYVLLEYDGNYLKNVKIVECGNASPRVGAQRSTLVEIHLSSMKGKAYFAPDGSTDGYIFFDDKWKIDLRRISVHRYDINELDDGRKTCFNDQSRCIYDPYPKKVKTHSSNTFSSACDLHVIKQSHTTSAVDGRSTDRFCLVDDDKYKKTFLLPDKQKYELTGICDGTKFRSARKESVTVPQAVPEEVRDDQNSRQALKVEHTPEVCENGTMLWAIFGAIMGVIIIGLIGGIVMIFIERKGKTKKQAYMRLQKMLKKEEPSGYTTVGQTQTQTQDDGGGKTEGGKTEGDNNKSAVSNPQGGPQ